jgi:Arc/MetJ family transcription regulator
MKTTIEIDEVLLKRVMALTGVKTRRSVVDYALRELAKGATVAKLVKEAPADYEFGDALDSSYDPVALREREVPE